VLTRFVSARLVALVALSLAPSVMLSGCKLLDKMAIATTTKIFKSGLDAFYAETDYELAKASGLSSLKLLEGITYADPENKDGLINTAQAFAGYALGFLEDEKDRLQDTDPDAADAAAIRAGNFYGRAYKYSTQAILLDHDQWTEKFNAPLDVFQAYLQQDFEKEDVPALFWTGFALGARINLVRDGDLTLLSQLPKAKAIAERVVELDEGYFFGAGRLFLATAAAGFPKALGGDPEKGKGEFLRALALTDGKFLTARVYYAQFYAVNVQDARLFKEQLQLVIDAPADIMPGQEMMTVIAKRRGARLLARGPELFETWE
jgi:hypothetical protein